MSPRITRRTALQGIAAAAVVPPLDRSYFFAPLKPDAPLEEFGYDQVAILGARQLRQRENVLGILTGLNEDSMLYPFRAMSDTAGKSIPGTSLPGGISGIPTTTSTTMRVGLLRVTASASGSPRSVASTRSPSSTTPPATRSWLNGLRG